MNSARKSRFPTLFLNVFARVWAIWGLVSFAASFLIVLIPSLLTALIPDPKGMAYFIKIAKVWMKIWLNLVGCPVTIRGADYFEKGKTYIVTCNHTSLLDAPLSSPFIPGPNQTIAKKEFARVPLFGWYYKRGAVIVDRKSDASRRKSFELMKAALNKGFHMCIYPEGTRNKTGAPLKKFYDGAFTLAIDTGYSIIPTVILNTGKALPSNRILYMLPYKLAIHFLAPIATVGKTTEALKNEVYHAMYHHYITSCPNTTN
ncbi:MAG: 1-acyl-sn-glycerol-3-phosphate acyltransferase [Sphingobacteriia bacterium]|nr:MAG: 1-acyl-sn-glycerol-3-phosphate acyltransferase [Sphingobacteriia bacterium]TAG32185.1 MAG: 1-acyl-sn-glycerol-3-phosphate acyltransferase [Sphingobacteriia bacterium]TAH09286.1 MAG: 1-acyl-sn-glycerol-3-phosphate acyltransferase [Sphingobacteriia bacterium]